DRDPFSLVWGRRSRGHFALEAVGAFAGAPALGGELGGCGGTCTWTVAHGGLGVLRAAYELPQGLGVGLEVGGMGLGQFVDRRAVRITGAALRPNAIDAGSVNDAL